MYVPIATCVESRSCNNCNYTLLASYAETGYEVVIHCMNFDACIAILIVKGVAITHNYRLLSTNCCTVTRKDSTLPDGIMMNTAVMYYCHGYSISTSYVYTPFHSR